MKAKSRHKIPMLLLAITFSFMSISCEIDYDKYLQSTVKEKDNGIPSIEAYNFNIHFIKDSHLEAVATASKTRIYSELELQDFENFKFQTYNDNEEVETDGNSDTAESYTNKEDIELFGNVTINSHKEKSLLEGQYIKWVSKDKLVFGKENDLVKITKEDGDMMMGKGFSFDARRQLLEFTRDVTGKVEDKENDVQQDNKQVNLDTNTQTQTKKPKQINQSNAINSTQSKPKVTNNADSKTDKSTGKNITKKNITKKDTVEKNTQEKKDDKKDSKK